MAVTYIPLATQTLSTSASSITFSSIPATYTDLELVLAMNNSGSTTQVSFNLNGTTTGYSRTSLFGTGSTAQSVRASNQSVGYFAISNDPSGNGAMIKASFLNYANTSVYKTVLSRWSSTAVYVTADVNLWQNTAAISTILITAVVNNFPAGTTASLYGIASAAVGTPKATGGNRITTDGSYWYHAFTASGTFTPSSALSCDVLVVAGGGGGSVYAGGGGGAGGVLGFATQSLNSAQTVTVGSGGAGYTGTDGIGAVGSNSQFASLTASVGGGYGGGGGGVQGTLPSVGGSGGGVRGLVIASGAAGTSGQGFAGGSTTATTNGGGGGGGAGSVGANGTGTEFGGNGGAGVNTYTNATWLSTALSATGLGVSNFIAGGGGGSAGASSTAGTATGGGGAGSVNSGTNGTNGTANTGGGGGGAWYGATSGAGGSGLVIVRYAV